MKVKKILIPTDFSQASQPALYRGLDLARQFKAEAHFLNVVRTAGQNLAVPMFDMPPQTEVYTETSVEVAEKALADGVKKIVGDFSPVITRVEQAPYVPTALVRYAEENEIDLIVMGTHGRRGPRRFLLGSVAEELVRKAPCPVMTVGPEVSEEAKRPKRILGAVDLEEGTSDVVRYSTDLAELYHAEITFLHVVPPIYYPVYTELGPPVTVDPVENNRVAYESMKGHMQGLGVSEEDVDLRVVSGVPDVEIVEQAGEVGADMIVVATHARTGLPHVLLGSVADRVVRTAECPVLTVLGGARKGSEGD